MRSENGELLDEVLLTVFRGPRSYTGEDVVEIGCHGGILVTRKVLEALFDAGARPAVGGQQSELEAVGQWGTLSDWLFPLPRNRGGCKGPDLYLAFAKPYISCQE